MLLGQSGGLGGVVQHPLDALSVGGLELLCQLRIFVDETLGGAEAGVGDHGVGAGDPLPLLFKAERPAYFAVLVHRGCDLWLDQGGIFRLAGGQQGGHLGGAGVDDFHILTHRQPGFIQEILGQSVRRRGLEGDIDGLAGQIGPGFKRRVRGHEIGDAPGIHIHQAHIQALVVECGNHSEWESVQVVLPALDHGQQLLGGVPHIQVDSHILSQQSSLHHVQDGKCRGRGRYTH